MQSFPGAASTSECTRNSLKYKNFWSGMSHFQVPENTPEAIYESLKCKIFWSGMLFSGTVPENAPEAI